MNSIVGHILIYWRSYPVFSYNVISVYISFGGQYIERALTHSKSTALHCTSSSQSFADHP